MSALTTGLVFTTAIFTVTAASATSYTTTESEHDNQHNLTSSADSILNSMRQMGLDVVQNDTEVSVSARMKMSDFMLNPFMFIPQLIMWGFAPILLANLKMFVMQALMLNKMALSSAIFMTLRNIVFGPRPGHIVKYANHGYGHDHGHSKVHHYHRRS